MKKRSVYFIASYFVIALLLFLFIQKPFFLAYCIYTGASFPTFKELVQIYSYGLVLDISASAYVTSPVFLIILFSIFFKKLRVSYTVYFYNVIISILLGLVVLADASLYEFWEFKLDASIFPYLKNPSTAFASVTVSYLLLHFFIWLLLSFLWFSALSIPVKLLLEGEGAKFQKVYISLPIMLIVGGLLFAGIRGLRSWPNTPTRATFSDVTFLNHVALNPLFNLIYTSNKVSSDEEDFRFYPEEIVVAELPRLFPTDGIPSNRFLKRKRPNILLIVMESFGNPFIESLGGMKGVAPNLSHIAETGVCFTHCYCGSYRTDRGIVCILSGYPGQPTKSIIRDRRRAATLPGIPATLKTIGYESTAVYAGDVTYFNMLDYFYSTGHKRIISKKNFPYSLITQEWGVPDGCVANWIYNDVTKNKSKKEPWFMTWLTLSSHGPWDVPYNRLNDKELNGFAYTDEVVGNLLDKFKKSPIWDNLLIVLIADHGFRGKGLSMSDKDFPFIPLIFTGGAVKGPMKVETLCSQTDLAAILLGQLGVSHIDYKFSRDVLSDTYIYPFAFQTFNNGFNFRDSTGCTVYDNVAERSIYGSNNKREATGKLILQAIYKDFGSR